MFPLLERAGPNPLELFQIWLNLPARDKFVEPHFSMLWSRKIPKLIARDSSGKTAEVTLIAGRIGDLTPPKPPPSSWAAHENSDVAIWTVKMTPGAVWTLPAALPGTNRTLYFFVGSSLRAGNRILPPHHAAHLRPEREVTLEAGPDATEILLLQGRPIAEPVVQYGPFVMNTRDEIHQAFADYQRTQFGGWPWKSDDPVHGREEGRFARHADGRLERPV
jgi:redox-sensitive bicupin YhaK (pirin superfamily)